MQETDRDYRESVEPWYDGSDWHDAEGYGNELHSEETDWNENCCETDDHDTTDDIFSEDILALLEQPVETRRRRE